MTVAGPPPVPQLAPGVPSGPVPAVLGEWDPGYIGRCVGDLLGHIALPAKITIRVLEPIDVRERFGPDPDVDAVYASVTALMQRALDELAADRRWPVIG
jgi:hypothetical protein